MVLSLLIVIAFLIWHISNIFSLIRIPIIQPHFIPVVLPLGFLKPAQLLCKGSRLAARWRSRREHPCPWVPARAPAKPCVHHVTQGKGVLFTPSSWETHTQLCVCRNRPQPLFLTTGNRRGDFHQLKGHAGFCSSLFTKTYGFV